MPDHKLSPWRWLLVLPLAISIVVALVGGVYVFNGLAASGWETAEGTIVESGFPLKYEFTVEDERREGSVLRHTFLNPSEKELKEQYPVGKSVTVYYAPSEGTYLTVLEPGFHFDSILVTVLALVFAFLWWKGLRPASGPQQEKNESEPPADE